MFSATEKNTTVRNVLWQILALNLLVSALKIGLGLVSGALSIVADGFHSLVDGSSNVVGLIAMKIATAPPDEEHPYGHRKAETLATMTIGVFLLLAAYEILKSSISRFSSGVGPEITPISFAVMTFTVCVNLVVTTYESWQGKRVGSDILQADAQHTRSDIWVSLSVIAGLVGVQLGFLWVDALVGLVIAGVIGYTAIQILYRSANVLMDQAVLPSAQIESLALALPGVQSVERIRSRGLADQSYVDLHVRVKPDMPTQDAHSIAHAVQHKIKETYPQATDVTVHIEPEPAGHTEHPDMSTQLKSIARSLGGFAHEIWVHSVESRYFVELHLEVSPELSLAEAHQLASQLEERGKQAMPEITNITTHIEPLGEVIQLTDAELAGDYTDLLSQAQKIAGEISGPDTCHNLRAYPEAGGLSLNMHCVLPPQITIVEAHAVSRRMEEALRHQIPELVRVLIHVEPPQS